MLEVELAHRKVLRVAGCERRGDRHGRCGDQAVGLREGDSGSRVIASPPASDLTLLTTDLEDPQPVEELICSGLLVGPKASMDLLHVDRGGV